MTIFHYWMAKLPLGWVILAAGTLGLAPFVPEPHVWEKLQWLAAGQLVKPIDWFDLLLHGTPIIMLILKTISLVLPKPERD